MKEVLYQAFCDQIAVRKVPAGLAVSTAFTLSGGEPLGFYIVGPDPSGRFRLQDDGTTVPMIEAAGVDLDTQTRNGAISTLYTEYGDIYNQDAGDHSRGTPSGPRDRIPR